MNSFTKKQTWSTGLAQVTDQEARNMARAALNQIQSHEDACEIRDSNKMAILNEIKDSVAGLYQRFWVAALSTIAMLGTACTTLIWMVIHPN